MNWSSASQIAERTAGTICLLALAGGAIFAARKIGQAADQATAVTQQLTTTLAIVNRPCAPGPCGTLAEINKAAVKLQDVTVTLQRQVQQSSILVNSSASAVASAAQDIHRLTESAQGTLDAGTSTLRASQEQIEAAGPVLASAQATVGHLDTAVQDLDAQIKATDLPGLTRQLTDASGQMTLTLTNVTAITGDTKQVADKMTADYLKPVPWWKWPVQKIGQIWDVAAAVARHTP